MNTAEHDQLQTVLNEAGNEIWWKFGCVNPRCVTKGAGHSTRPQILCVTCGEPNLIMQGLIVADDIITIASLMVKSDSEHRQAEQLAIAARADLNRVNDLVYKRINEQQIRT